MHTSNFILCLLSICLVFSEELSNETVITGYVTWPLLGTPPSPRSDSVIVKYPQTSSANKKINAVQSSFYCFGGMDGNKNYFTDVYKFTPGEGWRPVEINGIRDSPKRVQFAWFIYNESFWMWGGMGPDGFYDDLWRYSFTTHEWYEESQEGVIPSARQQTSFTYTNEYLYLFGGRDNAKKQTDFWKFNFKTKRWTNITQYNLTENIETLCNTKQNFTCPSGRKSGQLLVIGNRAFVFGGYGEFTNYDIGNDTIWCGNISESENETKVVWKFVLINETATLPTFHHDAGYSVWNDVAFVFGGRKQTNTTVEVTNELLVIDFTNALSNFSNITTKNFSIKSYDYTDQKCAKLSSSAFVLSSFSTSTNFSGYVFGGVKNPGVSGKFFGLGVNSSEPQENQTLNVSLISDEISNIPTQRTHHSAVYAVGKMWIFGGLGETPGNGLDSSAYTTAYLNDLYSLDIVNLTNNESNPGNWTKAKTKGNTKPQPRAYATLTQHGYRLILFGGLGVDKDTDAKQLYNDVWAYSIIDEKWTLLSSPDAEDSKAPKPRFNAVSTILHKHLFVFGGRLADNTVSNELWSFSLVDFTWRQMKYKTSGTNSSFVEPDSHPNQFTSFQPILTYSDNIDESTPFQAEETEHPVRRGGASLLCVQRKINGVERDVLVIAGGVDDSRTSIREPDVLALPQEEFLDELDQDDSLVEVLNVTCKYENEKDPPMYRDAPTAATPNGFFIVGGLKVDDAKNKISFLDFTNVTNPEWYRQSKAPQNSNGVPNFNESAADSADLPNLAGGSAVFFGRKLFVFGGTLLSKKLPSDNQFTNTLYVFTLNSSYSTCSLGSADVGDSSGASADPFFDNCVAAKPGTFIDSTSLSVNGKNCKPGTYNPYSGGSSAYTCLPCPAGSFNDQEAQSKCQGCNGAYCPIGSRTLSNKRPELIGDPDHQPQNLEIDTWWSLIMMLIFYGAGAALGVLLALILVCLPSRFYLFKLDFFSDKHNNSLDPTTNTTPKIIKKTRLGGFVSIIFIAFAIGAAGDVIYELIANNVLEQKNVVYRVMDSSKIDMTELKVDSMTFQVIFHDFLGNCSKPMFVPDLHRIKCASDHSDVSKRNSSNSFLIDPTICTVTMVSSDCTVTFTDTDDYPYFIVNSTDKDAAAYAVEGSVEAESGIILDKKITTSKLSTIVRSTNGTLLKGSNPTHFNFTALGSLFDDQTKNKNKTGLYFVESKTTSGMEATPAEYHSKYFISAKIELHPDPTIVKTTWSPRQTFASFLANVMSTVMGFMGIFGGLVVALEVISELNLPCGNSLKKKLLHPVVDDEFSDDESVLHRGGMYDPLIGINKA